MPSYQLIYITCPDLEISRKISSHLLENKLIACANIFPAGESQYMWEGKIESSQEHTVILKSISQNFSAIEQQIKKLHPYDTPCIIALDSKNIHEPFANWITGNTEEQ